MTEKEMFLASFEREFDLILAALKSFPSDEQESRPQEEMRFVREHAWSMTHDQTALIEGAIAGDVTIVKEEPPTAIAGIIEAYEQTYRTLKEMLSRLPEPEWNVPITIHQDAQSDLEMKRADVFWLALSDARTHREQLTAYRNLVTDTHADATK